jgi:hypothetical protein
MMLVLHKVATFIWFEFVVRPEGVVEGKVPMLAALWILGIEESCHISNHIDAKLTVEITLALVEGPDSDPDFDTH